MRLIDADKLMEKKYIYDGQDTIGYRRWVSFSEIEDEPTVEIRPDNCGFENGFYALKDGVWYKLNLNTKWDDGKMIKMPPLKLDNLANWNKINLKNQE